MHTNIPTPTISSVIYEVLKNQAIQMEIIQEITELTKTISDQKYFCYYQQYYKQEGLAMGAPTSAMLSEIYLQHLDHNEINNLLRKYNIISY
jgi:hypothetical protein